VRKTPEKLTLMHFSTPELANKWWCLLYRTWFTMDRCPCKTICGLETSK